MVVVLIVGVIIVIILGAVVIVNVSNNVIVIIIRHHHRRCHRRGRPRQRQHQRCHDRRLWWLRIISFGCARGCDFAVFVQLVWCLGAHAGCVLSVLDKRAICNGVCSCLLLSSCLSVLVDLCACVAHGALSHLQCSATVCDASRVRLVCHGKKHAWGVAAKITKV